MSSPRKFLRLPQVIELTGLCRSALYEMVQAGTFPAPIAISERARAWDSEELAAWQEARLKARPARLVRPGNVAASGAA